MRRQRYRKNNRRTRQRQLISESSGDTFKITKDSTYNEVELAWSEIVTKVFKDQLLYSSGDLMYEERGDFSTEVIFSAPNGDRYKLAALITRSLGPRGGFAVWREGDGMSLSRALETFRIETDQTAAQFGITIFEYLVSKLS